MSEPEPIEKRLKPAYDERRIAATWSRIAAARARLSGRSTGRWLIGVACAAAIAVAIYAWPRTAHEDSLTNRDPAISVAPGAVWTASGRDLVFDDASTIALATGARIQVLANDGTRFSTLLERGTARFDVHPGGPRRWEIETSLATVEVVGTAFTVALHARELEVGVERGVVVVRGELVPGRVVRLTAGEHLVVEPPTTTSTQVPPTEPIAPIATVAPPPPLPKAPTPRAAMPAVVPTQTLATVVAEADRLSSTGDPAGAARLLEDFRKRGGDRASGLVAFSLGRLYLDVLGKPGLAAVAFAEVIERGNPRTLVEDAYAHRVEALLRANQRDAAVAALADYERTYPQGRRIGSLRALLKAP